MTIPEDTIMSHLNTLLTSSSPGATMHHLHVVAAPVSAIGPLGLFDPKQLDTTIYAMAPDQCVDVEEFIANIIMTAAFEAHEKGNAVLFAGLAQEIWSVDPIDELAEHLGKMRRLHEHPNVAEVTVAYGACRDGRRWRGRRFLTGPKAGTTEDVDLLVGRPQPHEAHDMPSAPLVRRLVGLS